MLKHHVISAFALVSMLCFPASCDASKNLSSTATSSTAPEKETSLYEDSDFSKINKLEGSIGIIQVRGKEVYFDQKRGKLLKPLGYFQDLSPFSEGLASVSKNGKIGFIKEDGEWAITPRFKGSFRTGFREGAALIRVGEKERFINKQGEFFTPAFDFTRPFNKGVAVVMVNNKYGLINKQGKFIISPQFAEEPRGNFTQGGMLVKNNGQEQCIDNSGAQIKADACKYILEDGKPIPTAFEVRNGSVYLQGKLLPNYRWDRVMKSQGNNNARGTTYRGIYVYVIGNKWGLVHESGEVVTPAQFDVTHVDDPKKKVLFDYQYFYNGLAQAKVNGKYGFIDETGKFIIPPKFEAVESFAFDARITAVKLGNKWGAIDRKGNIVIQPKFESVFQFDRRFSSLAMFKQKNKYGFIDRQGNIVIPAQIDEIRSQDFANRPGNDEFYDSLPNEGLAPARIGKKWGYVNTQGKIQIPMKFDEASDFRYGVAAIKLGTRILYIDRQGKTLPF
jgi:WG containing repeat